MNVNELFSAVKDTATVKRVYGEPYEKDGVTVIPAASVSGGVGGGTGHDEKGGEGEGGGFGVRGRPAGAYVVKGGDVSWQPAIDPNRIVVGLVIMVVAYLVTRPRMARARARQR